MSVTSAAGARELRRQMRSWRRERADTTIYEQLSEAYIWVFSTVVVGAMAISVLIQARVNIADGCTTASCDDARTSLVWASAVGVIAVALAAAAAVGPIMVTPATGAWLLTTPIDRRPLLRARLVLACVTSALACGLVVTATALLGGLGYGPLAVLGVTAAIAGAAAAAGAAAWQSRGGRATHGLAIILGAVVWIWMLLIALDHAPATTSDWINGPAGWAMLAVAGVALVGLTARAFGRLGALLRAQLIPGGSLLSSLSGALASLDLTLAYDVLVARRWLNAATVRPVRGGPSGMWALVWRDVVRLRRSIGAVTALAAAAIVPYVVVALGLDAAVIPLTAFTAFVSGLWLFSALRTTGRNPGLVRCFPMSLATVRSATLIIPGAALAVWSLATAPAIAHGLDNTTPSEIVLVSLTTSTASLGAIARWLLAPPPDYSQPLVSTPAGGLPTGLILSALRGFDVLLLAVIPLLAAPNATGAMISLSLTALVTSILVNRR